MHRCVSNLGTHLLSFDLLTCWSKGQCFKSSGVDSGYPDNRYPGQALHFCEPYFIYKWRCICCPEGVKEFK